jgi:chromate transporter
MCGPSAVVAYFVSDKLTRSRQSVWPAILQAALVPVSIGLMSASGFILALTTGDPWVAMGLVVCAARLALMTWLNPLWILDVGGILGFAGVV